MPSCETHGHLFSPRVTEHDKAVCVLCGAYAHPCTVCGEPPYTVMLGRAFCLGCTEEIHRLQREVILDFGVSRSAVPVSSEDL